MSSGEITSGSTFLSVAAQAFFEHTYQTKSISSGQPIDRDLNWSPSLSFKTNSHRMIVAEVSPDKPYPLILRMRRADILGLNMPIAVYSVCPEQAYLDDQAQVKELMSHGYGLLTVDAAGIVTRRSSCVPLIQLIPANEFADAMKGLPGSIRARLAESFERYNSDPLSGVSDIAEVFEGLVLKAGRDAVKKGWLSKSDAKAGAPASTLLAMQQSQKFKNAAAAIGGAQSYISEYRNTAHHTPKNKEQAAKKYRDCRHGFLEGLRKIPPFRTAMKNLGLTGGLEKI
ncbi:hypothetical protein L2Y96_02185 [Luteibacter aegosomaticola]|uniref:hypothetical protein n=1 Tax=Luteibacter aegosomaticola TaxID=2911538 RepID=UPI001FF973BB|nr:hypothetical protein [Luteibacter aegosomaticola]UPG90603.1 hypothetical protein L2Y96_02185 [Luteibacter aegosomaticola]